MEPLFKVETECNFEEYKRFYRAIMNKINKLPVLIAVMMGMLFLLACLKKDLVYVFIAILVPITFRVIEVIIAKKVYESNKMLKDITLNYEFYEEYFEQKNTVGNTKIVYDKIYMIVETDTNFYIMIARNQGYIVNKGNCSQEFIGFIRKIRS